MARDGLGADFQCYALPIFRDDIDFVNCSKSLAGIARYIIVHAPGKFRGYKLRDVHSAGFLPRITRDQLAHLVQEGEIAGNVMFEDDLAVFTLKLATSAAVACAGTHGCVRVLQIKHEILLDSFGISSGKNGLAGSIECGQMPQNNLREQVGGLTNGSLAPHVPRNIG
jgi:hypothetical protein